MRELSFHCLTALLTVLLLATPSFAQDQGESEAPVFARVAGVEITTADYAAALRAQARRLFYHGAPPEAELAAFHRQVADDLVERVLVQQEGLRRGTCEASPEDVLNDPAGARECRDALREAVLDALPPVREEQVRQFFQDNPEMFREPERVRASVILVKVPPSAGTAQWQQTLEQVQGLRERLSEGEDSFEDLAREYSEDASATQGGDMGYIHAGMLGQTTQEALAELEPGQVSEPVVLLEGVALLRLEERRAARQREYTNVSERAAGLYREQRNQDRWQSFLAGLRDQASVTMDESYLQPQGPDAPTAGRP